MRILLCSFLLAISCFAQAEERWLESGADGRPTILLYFFWSATCPHCLAAHPHVTAMVQQRPWVGLKELELSRDAANVRRFQQAVAAAGPEAQANAGVPAFLLCGEMHFGWDGPDGMGKRLTERLDACHARALAGQPVVVTALELENRIEIPLIGQLDLASFSLPAMTLVLAGLDAFNPCAFFVLLFLLSMMSHQKSRARMLQIGGVFVLISGLMYFAFMAAWLNVFQIFGHLAWVTGAAGVLAVLIGAVNIKDFFWFGQGVSLSIPEARKPTLFRRARAILDAGQVSAMLAATAVLAIAANFYELLCTAGFPMVYTRLLTLADLSETGRYAYLAAYNLIYVLPLAAIVAIFARTLGMRKLTEREGRLLKLLSGLMMLQLGLLLLIAPDRVSQVGIAFGMMLVALLLTRIAARVTR